MQVQQEANTFELNRHELLPGDVLIVTDTRKKTNSFNKLTRTTQSTQLLFKHGHNEAVHAQIIARDDTGALKIVEVSDDGVLLADIAERYRYNLFVYRPMNRVLAERAGKVAYEGYKEFRQLKEHSGLEQAANIAEDGEAEAPVAVAPKAETNHKRPEIKYSDGGLVHAVVFPVLLFPYHFTSTHFSLKSFCSKFVIQCFQIAQHQLIKENPALKKDIERLFRKEKTSSVKSLENYVKKHKDFKPFIIPREQETIYPSLVKVILMDAITTQRGNKTTAEKANKAWEIYQRLTSYVEQQQLLKNPNFKHFDLAIAIYAAVLASLPVHKQVEKNGYEFGFERHMISDNRIMQLQANLLEQSKALAKPEAPNRDITLIEDDSDEWEVIPYYN